MGILLCEQNFRDVWRRNKSVGQKFVKFCAHTHKHTHAAKLVVRIWTNCTIIGPNEQKPCTEINIRAVEMSVIRINMRKSLTDKNKYKMSKNSKRRE